MPAKTSTEAVNALFVPLRKALSCVTPIPLLATGYFAAPHAHLATFPPLTRVVRLRSDHDLHLAIDLYYTLTRKQRTRDPWNAVISGYVYALCDAQERELVAFHWHPQGNNPVTDPHIHVRAQAGPLPLFKAHIPTVVISLATVIRFAIAELGVQPLRPDWHAILNPSGEVA